MDNSRDESQSYGWWCSTCSRRDSSTTDSICDERGCSFGDSHQECVEEEVSGETSGLLTRESVRDSIRGTKFDQESSAGDPSQVQTEAVEGSQPLHHSSLSRDKPQTEASHQSAEPSAGHLVRKSSNSN